MTFLTLHSLFTDQDEALKFVADNNLLYNDGECENCHHTYQFYQDNSSKTSIILKCTNCKNKKSVFHKSIFTRSKIPITKILHIIYCWSMEYTRDQTVHETKVCPDTVTNFFQACRQACIEWYNAEGQSPIGGPGHTVEIDETLMPTRKNHCGRVLSQQWLFGGVCRETKEKFIIPVPDRTSSTLIPIIQAHISPNSQINSDCWRAYKTLNTLPQNYIHEEVNHSTNFVNPITKAHTQTVERMWRSVKRVKRRAEGLHNKDIQDHVAVYLWRDRFHVNHENGFMMIIKLIGETYYE